MNDVSHRIHAIPVCFSGNVTPWQPAGNAPSDPPSSATLLRPEQTVELAPEVADYAYVPQTGRTALERLSSELADDNLPRPGDRGRLIAPVSACPPPVARSVRPRPTSATVCKSVQSCTSLAVRAKHPSRKYRARSSAGEHYLDTVGVTGSIPVAPTSFHNRFKQLPPLPIVTISRLRGAPRGNLAPAIHPARGAGHRGRRSHQTVV